MMSLDTLTYCDKIAKKILDLTAVGLFLMLLVWLIYAVVSNITSFVVTPAIGHIYSCVALCLIAVMILAATLRLVLSFFIKSDEQADFEEKVNYVLEKRQTHHVMTPSQYSPLQNLSDEQQTAIKQMLAGLPEHSSKVGYINMAIMAQYLTALQQLGYADLQDKNNLRRWVMEITGKQVPSSSAFNEAIPSTVHTKVNKAKEKITLLLQ